MRVALIQSSKEKRAAFVEKPYIPGALLSLASYLKGQGFSPQIIDLNMFSLGKKISSNFFKKAAQRILRDKPEALCFSVMCNTFPASLLIAKECKRYARDIPIIFGGPEVSFEEAEVLETFGQVDVIVRGEGELTVTELLHAIKNNLSFDNICGITFRKKNTIVRNSDRPFIENLDDLPGLDFSLLPHPEKYGLGAIEAGRGCPFRCTFCSTCRMWKRKFRMKSPQKLADDLRRADATFKKYGFMNISVVHDHFLASSKRAEEFLSLIEGDGISWSCYSRLEALNERLIIKLKKAGCRMIFLGIESGSAEIQKKIGKNLPLSTLPEKLELLNKHGIFSELSFIIGFPDESLEQMNQTLLLALRSKLYAPFSSVQIYFLTLLKGSELYAQEKGRFRDNVFQETGGLSPLITDLPQELALIKKYPHIFPSFYYLNNGAIMLAELQAIRNLFTYCIEFYPLTTMLLLEKLSITPLELGRRVGGAGLYEEYVENNGDVLIKESFKHEQLIRMSPPEMMGPRRVESMGIHSCPKLAKAAKIMTYNHDVSSLGELLKNNQGKKVRKADSSVAYLPGRIILAFDPFYMRILDACNGKRSVEQIVREILEPGERSRRVTKGILETLRFFGENGLLYDSRSLRKAL